MRFKKGPTTPENFQGLPASFHSNGYSYCITTPTGQSPILSSAPFFLSSSARYSPPRPSPLQSSLFLDIFIFWNKHHSAPQHEHRARAEASSRGWRLVFRARSEAPRPSLHSSSRLLLPFLPHHLCLRPRSGRRYLSHFTHSVCLSFVLMMLFGCLIFQF